VNHDGIPTTCAACAHCAARIDCTRRHSAAARLLDAFTSRRAATLLIVIGMLALGARLVYPPGAVATDVALGLMAASLGLAVAWRWRALARAPGLLVFHAALALLLAALLFAPLLRGKGYFELAEGQVFRGQFIDYQRGALAAAGPSHWQLVQGPIAASYRHAEVGKAIDSTLTSDATGEEWPVRFMRALAIDGYRIEPTGNMGYAVVLAYRGHDGRETRGLVNFPGYPLARNDQINRFMSPDGQAIEVRLELIGAPYREREPWSLDLPITYRLVVGAPPLRLTLAPGEERQLFVGGTLRVEGLVRWLGYSVTRDPLAPVLAVAGILALLGLLWHGLSTLRHGLPWTH
jgi:hypothetical protein